MKNASANCSQRWLYDLMHEQIVLYHSEYPQLWQRPLYRRYTPKLVPNFKKREQAALTLPISDTRPRVVPHIVPANARHSAMRQTFKGLVSSNVVQVLS